MFNLSGSEIIVILLLALVILGPEKLPDAIRRAGRTYSELKKMGNSFQAEMKSVLDEPMKEMRETADLLKQSVDFTDGELSGKTTPTRVATARKATAVAAAAAELPPAAEAAAAVDDGTAAPTPATDADAAAAADAADADASVPDSNGEHVPDAGGPAPAPPADLSPEDELINRTLSGEA